MPTATTEQTAFSLKSAGAQLTVMALHTTDINAIRQQARDMTEKMPQFFENLPIVLDCSQLAADDFSLESLLSELRACALYPVGFRGASEKLAMRAKACGLAPISTGTKPAPTQNTPAPELLAEPKSALAQNTRIIHTPVRSGQQIYASGCDLVVIGTVSAGAEVIADGNIHIYGKLRGKALAGAKGNPDARIFCADMQAELISIAGIYRLEEDISKRYVNVCVWLEEEILQMMEMAV